MQFTRYESQGDVRVMIDPENACFTGITIDDVSIDEDTLVELMKFRTTTYKKVNGDTRMSGPWKIVYGFVNDFIKKFLTEEEQAKLCQFFIEVRVLFLKASDDSDAPADYGISALASEFGEKLIELDTEIDLFPKLYDYSSQEFKFPDLSNAGKRAQDSKEMTFNEEHYKKLTAVVILCKLLAPLFGELISAIQNKEITADKTQKEVFCAIPIQVMMRRRDPALMDKLSNYITRAIESGKTRQGALVQEYTEIAHGRTSQSNGTVITAVILIKRLVNLDPQRPDGNLLTYIHTCARETHSSMHSNHRSNQSVMPIEHRDFRNEDEGNQSRIEVDTPILRVTPDTPVIVKLGVEQAIESLLQEKELNRKVWASAVDFYKREKIVVTPINKLMVCTYMGARIGGAKGIDMINSDTYAKIIALIQYQLINEKMIDLANIASMTPGGLTNQTVSIDQLTNTDTSSDDQEPNPSNAMSSINLTIQLNWDSTYAVRNCYNLFEQSHLRKRVKNLLGDCVHDLISYQHKFNTASVFWDLMKETVEPSNPLTKLIHDGDENNEKPLVYGTEVIRDLCVFLTTTMES